MFFLLSSWCNCLCVMVFRSQRSLIDRQEKRNILTAKKYVHAHGNSKHWNNKPSIKSSWSVICGKTCDVSGIVVMDFYWYTQVIVVRSPVITNRTGCATTRTGSFFLFGKFLLVREVMLSIYLIRTGRNFPNGKSDFNKMKLELKYGFWNFNSFLDW